MSETTIIDDVFIGGKKSYKKNTVREIIGVEDMKSIGHQKYYSDRFVPFVTQRDVRGRIIKREAQKSQVQKHINLWKMCLQNDANNKNKVSKQDSSIDMKFKFHEVDHFKNSSLRSRLQTMSELKKDLKTLETKNYEKRQRVFQRQGDIWFTNYKVQTPENNLNLSSLGQQQKQKQNPITKKRAHSLKNLKSPQNLNKNKRIRSQSVLDKLKDSRQKSLKNLLKRTPNQNPQLQQIQRQVKVHFNHPQLDRYKQSKKLAFRFLENIAQGDKKFKLKVEEYRTIKERIKNQMAKI